MTESSQTESEKSPGTDEAASPAADEAKTIKRLRFAAILLMVGIITEIIAMASFSPGTFMFFVFVGAPAMVLGIVIEVHDLVRRWRAAPRES